ncbi:TIGR01212 family radical SAM protein [uncultured Treponema sp.]|uniref:TIGR01212 family radical SAM protein n=1 Tax=uncultured Treponema sp. TaxID=162155 RepID=UPI0025F337BC|nr:TIGR01212 family radical SAM protein [uncultured Treponema sp.]
MIKLSDFYESIFGSKTYKLSLDAGCTCPNRDGTKAFGGCIFCSESGSGDFASSRLLSIKEQVESAKKRVESKIKGRGGTRKGKYIAYFQNFTSTYGDSKLLLSKYHEALLCSDVAGLAIATRPDCLEEEILSGIAEIAENHFVQIELGLQTSNEKTGLLINRCYTNEDYILAVQKIRSASEKIHIVTHLIFGLPGENEKDMIDSIKFVVKQNSTQNREKELFWGIKITVLYVLRNTKIAEMYDSGELKTLSKEEYFLLLRKSLEILPENCVIHRLTGDPPKNLLISPLWTMDKKRVLNEIKDLY